MNDYLSKPVDRRRLLEKVQRWGEETSAPPAPPAEASPPTTLVDEEILGDLRGALGEATLRCLLVEFLAQLVSVERELPGLESAELRDRAHQLRGTAGAFGFTRLSDVAGEADRALKAGCGVDAWRRRLGEVLPEAIRVLSVEYLAERAA
jgi:HPt (histidine-containing phosphotransfer) domain-containing protein